MLVPEALVPRWCQHNTVRHRQHPHTASHPHKKISVYPPSLSKDKEATVIVADDEDLARERKQHQCGANAENREQSLYWVAIQQLPPEPLDDYNGETTVMRYYNSYGEIVEEEDDSLCCKYCHICFTIHFEIKVKDHFRHVRIGPGGDNGL